MAVSMKNLTNNRCQPRTPQADALREAEHTAAAAAAAAKGGAPGAASLGSSKDFLFFFWGGIQGVGFFHEKQFFYSREFESSKVGDYDFNPGGGFKCVLSLRRSLGKYFSIWLSFFNWVGSRTI